VPALARDLAIEVLSAGNTPEEMTRKLKDYFAANVKLVWFIDPALESATVDESAAGYPGRTLWKEARCCRGFELPLKQLFDQAGRRSGSEK